MKTKIVLVALALLLIGCSSDPTISAEYIELEGEFATATRGAGCLAC